MNYLETAVNRKQWIKFYQRAQWFAVAIFLLGIPFYVYSYLPSTVVIAGVILFILTVVGFGVPKYYLRDVVSIARNDQVNSLLRQFKELRPGNMLTKKNLDPETVDLFYHKLQSSYHGDRYKRIDQSDSGAVSIWKER